MIYEKRLTIPSQTLASVPALATVEVHPGKVQQVSIYFPPGCAGLAHFQVYLWEHLVWPSNPNADFAGDGMLISFPEDLDLVDPPYEFTLAGWNDDDTYPHTVTLRLQVQPFGDNPANILARLLVGPAPVQTPWGG